MATTTSFTGVHSFRLKYPQYTSFRNKISSKGEWIELYKNRNELPTAKLRTWVLYYRNNGLWYGNTSPPTSGNYIFYDKGGSFTGGSATNNDGRQLGWIWGFPLFNVGATATNWPKWATCLGNTHGFLGGETHGNEKMLVDISGARNIIVLDFNGYNVDAFSSNAKSTDKIKDNIDTGTNKGFYLTLRLKSSQENELKHFKTFNGKAADAGPGGWATLVEYVYECDIIGPKDMLDFTLDYFLYLDGNNTKLFGENLTINNRRYKLAHIPSNEANTYHDNLKISIITGLGPSTENNTVSNWINNDRLMDTDGIYNDLVYNGTTNKVLQKWIGTSTQETTNRVTVTKIIGGYYSQMGFSNPDNHIGYYGDNFGTEKFQTRMVSHGWNKTTTLRNKDCDNGVNRDDSTLDPSYNLNNILWCSLNSPRKTKVRLYGNNGKFNYRFVDNYLDLNGIECSGGGYARFPNTIDLPRNNLKPYYSSNNNINTINLLKDFNSNLNQYFTDNNERTLNDIVDNHFKVYYKLLIPPLINEIFRIQYTFGSANNSTVTFFRDSGMNGTATPSGKSSLNAIREQETIQLEWTSNDIDSNNDITQKKIIFIDVASGFKKNQVLINNTDTALFNTTNSTTENYDLSFNVFQIQSYSIVGPNRADTDSTELNGNPYQQKTFKIEAGNQYIDISSVPLNYEPYRYINTNLPYIFNANSYRDITHSYAPLLIHDEGLKYSYDARYAQTNITDEGTKAEIVLNSVNTLDISINNMNKFSFNYNPTVTLDEESFIFLESGATMFDISINKIDLKSLDNENITFFRPFTLNLKNNLIPDYWRLFKPINEYFFNSIAEGLKNIPIEYNYQTTVSQMFKISNISVNLTDDEKLKIKYILINSNENNFDISALTENMVLATSNIIIDVLGEEFLNTKLDAENALIELKCNENEYNPFGINRVSYIGDSALPKDNNGGLNVPTPTEPDKRFSMTIPLNTRLSRNNGIQSSNDRRIWNNLYDIQIKFFDDGRNGQGQQNPDLNNVKIGPTDLKVLLVDIPNLNYITPLNEEGYPDISVKLNSDNTAFELNWKGFDFLQDDVSFNKTEAYGGKVGKKIEIIWNVQRESTTTAEVVTLLSGASHQNLNYNVVGDEVIYTFIDKTVRIFDKYKYKISAVCRWSGLADLLLRDGLITQLSDAPTAPSFNVNGFVTDEIFICKNNRFPYGRFNTTATNLKLYRPLLLRTVGQRDQFGNLIGGDCSVVQKSRPNVLSDGGSNNNIYINTADQMTKKETFKRLSVLRLKR